MTYWSYRFQTGNETEIVLDYAITLDPPTTDPAGLDGFLFVVSQDGNPIFSQAFGVERSGEIIVSIDPNTEYTISIAVMAEISGDVGSRTAFMDGDFVWGIGTGQ